jgi:hypothetical protein
MVLSRDTLLEKQAQCIACGFLAGRAWCFTFFEKFVQKNANFCLPDPRHRRPLDSQ